MVLSPDKLSFLEKILPARKEVEETDKMGQAELVDFGPNQDGATTMEKHMRMVVFGIRPFFVFF